MNDTVSFPKNEDVFIYKNVFPIEYLKYESETE